MRGSQVGVDDLVKDYRVAFLRYLPQHSEAALTLGYELGRRAAAGGAALLDLVQVHHLVLGELLAEDPPPDTEPLIEAACQFLTEVLSTFDMAHRALHEGRSAVVRPTESA